MRRFAVFGVSGLAEVRAGDDLADLLTATAVDLRDGDIVVLTSKIVSKAEGRVLDGVDREEAIDSETVRVVSEWTTPAAALDRRDPARFRARCSRRGRVQRREGTGRTSPARPRRVGQADPPTTPGAGRGRRGRRPHRHRRTTLAGRPDGRRRRRCRCRRPGRPAWTARRFGSELEVTVVAVVDELAAATETVRTKLAAIPVAVVRGLSDLVRDDDPGLVAALIRPAARTGSDSGRRNTRAAVFARRTVREFTAESSRRPSPCGRGRRHAGTSPHDTVAVRPGRDRRHQDPAAGRHARRLGRRPSRDGFDEGAIARHREGRGPPPGAVSRRSLPGRRRSTPVSRPAARRIRAGDVPARHGRGSRTSWSPWPPRAWGPHGCPRRCSAPMSFAPSWTCRPTGSRWGQWPSARRRATGERSPRDPDGFIVVR